MHKVFLETTIILIQAFDHNLIPNLKQACPAKNVLVLIHIGCLAYIELNRREQIEVYCKGKLEGLLL